MLTGESLIAGERVAGTGRVVHAFAPRTGAQLEPGFPMVDPGQVDRAARSALEAFAQLRSSTPADRARLLESIADAIEALGDALIERADAETALGVERLRGERARTTGQLRFFARMLRDGWGTGARIEHGDSDRRPAPRPDLRLRMVPVGPVAVFGSSNFPLAFSNAGGDTASALAAGCPVIVKAHNAHLGTAALVADAVADAVRAVGMPGGVYSSLVGDGAGIGQSLVAHPAIAAVGFTGSRAAGLALVGVAASRPAPIPVYAEMSSVNPVIVLPSALDAERAAGYVSSLTLGAGQFCTNPGLLFVPVGAEGDRFVGHVSETVRATSGATMLSSGIRTAFESARDELAAQPGVTELAEGLAGTDDDAPAARVFEAAAGELIRRPRLQHEMFGPAGLVVRYDGTDELRAAIGALEGQLTATVHAEDDDHVTLAELLPDLERIAGRIIVNGWPTGVEVSNAMVHGGPWPATSAPHTTSVGSLAIARFQRPVSYQNVPERLLPPELRDANPLAQERRVDGRMELP
ncbi:aldehyde dehydrogenase (NADP(+)) [Homoserinibacter sp. GY 40078]|uniref:aldehyde dehydrogenase (NADP(+)) n=1 Tax=Homoserinibacter sp. GY 40078 TaxID=2603275 RepID=UPI0011CAF3A5|nr:aldehyde dehydrogenase (NADP(+)) [Homoserinibacter sp. GY 40078]TXK16381.1 aldehyde dehydrogenase (NADP(+)) [Homoserinibacter sp. GY 40078]